MNWQVQEAKQRFSELVRRTSGPSFDDLELDRSTELPREISFED